MKIQSIDLYNKFRAKRSRVCIKKDGECRRRINKYFKTKQALTYHTRSGPTSLNSYYLTSLITSAFYEFFSAYWNVRRNSDVHRTHSQLQIFGFVRFMYTGCISVPVIIRYQKCAAFSIRRMNEASGRKLLNTEKPRRGSWFIPVKCGLITLLWIRETMPPDSLFYFGKITSWNGGETDIS